MDPDDDIDTDDLPRMTTMKKGRTSTMTEMGYAGRLPKAKKPTRAPAVKVRETSTARATRRNTKFLGVPFGLA